MSTRKKTDYHFSPVRQINYIHTMAFVHANIGFHNGTYLQPAPCVFLHRKEGGRETRRGVRGWKGPQTPLAAHASEWMEPIINQEQFLPIIQQEPGGGKRDRLALQLSVGDEGRKRKAERVKYYMKNRYEEAIGNWDKADGKRDEGMEKGCKVIWNNWRRTL